MRQAQGFQEDGAADLMKSNQQPHLLENPELASYHAGLQGH
jgi:hypothetical protein